MLRELLDPLLVQNPLGLVHVAALDPSRPLLVGELTGFPQEVEGPASVPVLLPSMLGALHLGLHPERPGLEGPAPRLDDGLELFLQELEMTGLIGSMNESAGRGGRRKLVWLEDEPDRVRRAVGTCLWERSRRSLEEYSRHVQESLRLAAEELNIKRNRR